MRKYRNSRQNASSFCASIVTADKVPNASGWNTLTADIVLATREEALSRPLEYLRRFSLCPIKKN